MFKLLVTDPGAVAKLPERGRPGAGDAIDGCIVQHDIGWYTTLARDLRAPGPQAREQRGIACRGRPLHQVATPRFAADRTAGARRLLAQQDRRLALQHAARALRQLQRAIGLAVRREMAHRSEEHTSELQSPDQ